MKMNLKDRIIILVFLNIVISALLSGCGMHILPPYYNSQEEAREYVMKTLETKYNREFVVIEEVLTQDVYYDQLMYMVKYEDENGVVAEASCVQRCRFWTLNNMSGIDDTYIETFYIIKVTELLEPFMELYVEKGEILEYSITISHQYHTKANLDMTLDELLDMSPTSEIWVAMVLEDEQEEEYYEEILYEITQVLYGEINRHRISLLADANGRQLAHIQSPVRVLNGEELYEVVRKATKMDESFGRLNELYRLWDGGIAIMTSNGWMNQYQYESEK